jgi:hypothetical protein
MQDEITGTETMSTLVASELWDMKMTSITRLCREGRIPGAKQDKKGCPWRIPVGTPKPSLRKRVG